MNTKLQQIRDMRIKTFKKMYEVESYISNLILKDLRRRGIYLK